MRSEDDLPLHHDSDDLDAGEEPRRPWLWVAGGLLLAAVLVAAVLVWRGVPEPAGSTAAGDARESPATAEAPQDIPLGPEVTPIDLPPLDETDAIVRDLVGALSSRPEAAAWLATDGLIRNLVTAVENVSEGKTPARHLKVLAPRERFTVTEAGGRVFADPRSFRRYDGLAQTIAALDTAGLTRLYATLRPRLVDAYRELGHPEGDVDAAVTRAIAHLLDAPVLTERTELREAVVSYRFTDPRLEGASPAQKQLMRMGPDNQALVQQKLRELAAALGIPDREHR